MILVVSDRQWVAAAFAAWSPTRNYAPIPTALLTSCAAIQDCLQGVEAIAFPHYSRYIPAEVYGRVPCIGFHLGDLPQGRGGTPLQNLLLRGIYKTTLCAFKITEELDAGPVYLREPVDIGEGSAEMIYLELAWRSLRMTERIVKEGIESTPQVGRPTVWARRTPSESALPKSIEPSALYDFIRMLDAPGYPRAFAEVAGYRVRFTGARQTARGLVAEAHFGGEDD